MAASSGSIRCTAVELAWCSLPSEEDPSPPCDDVQTRAERAHYRLSWQQRLARNALLASTPPLELTIYGLPASLAQYVQCGFVPAA